MTEPIGRPRQPLEKRFWSKVDLGDGDDCWTWKGGRLKGYGGVASGGARGRTRTAHRVSWEIHNGPIPPGEGVHGTCVLHRCDNPLCVNPGHLFLGTTADNTRDMMQKGRAAIGERNGSSKLTEPIVQWCRALHAQFPKLATGAALARRYGVSESGMCLALNRSTWRHVS